MKKFLENKPRMWFMICLCLVFVLLIVFIIFMFSGKPAKKVGADVVATVGDYEITIEEYKDFAFGVNRLGTPEKPLINEEVASKDQLLQLLAEKEIIEAEAKKLNISVTEEELNTAIAAQETDFDKYENGKQEVKDYISYVLLQDKMADYLTGEKEGQFIVAREDIHYKEGNQYTVAEKSKIESTQAYAKKFIDQAYIDLSTGKKTFEEVTAAEKADLTIGESVNLENLTLHSGSFNVDEWQLRLGIFQHPEIVEAVNQAKINEVSNPIHVTDTESDSDYKNIGWFIFKLTKSTGQGQGYESWLENLRSSAEYKVTIYLKVNDLL